MTYHYAARGGLSHCHAQKIGEDRTCSSENMIADKHTQRDTQTETDGQTERHAHHNTPLPKLPNFPVLH